ncbi:MAG: hypothetical protein ACJ76B_07680 [Solirubrobacterales bacterium]
MKLTARIATMFEPAGSGRTDAAHRQISVGLFAAMLVCAAAFLGIGASVASAAPEANPGWVFRVAFTGGSFQEPAPNGVAVDSSGKIFVAEQQNNVVHIFTPDPLAGGIPLIDFSVPGNAATRNVAVDPGDDTVYVDGVTANGDATIRRFLSDGTPTPVYTVDPGFEVPQGQGIAVDPVTHDLLVADPGLEAVRRYDTSGAWVETISTPGTAAAVIATRPDGTFYVASRSGPDILHLSETGTVLDTIVGVGEVSGLTWDPTDTIVVAQVGAELKTYSAAGQLLSISAARSSAADGLVFDPISGVLYQGAPGEVFVYQPGVVPDVEDPVVSALTGHSAHVEAEVEPGEEGLPGEAPAGSKAHLEYSADGGQNWKPLPDQELTEPGVATIKADLTDLLANFDYQVRVVAENASGNKATSNPVQFSTPEIAPDVETGATSGLGESTATLNGAVNPNGLQTTYHFEFGLTASYGSRVPIAFDAVAGNQRTSHAFHNALVGLTPGATYHYRIVATNAIGESAGADRTFITAGAGEAAPARAYELVTPVDKRGAQVANDLRFQAAPGGSAIAVNLSAGPSDGNSALIRQSYVMWRGADGWSDWVNADAPQSADPASFYEASTLAYSKDFRKALVVSNRELAPGGIAGGGNLYVKDLHAGTYTFVGGAPGGNAYAALAGLSVSSTVFVSAAPDFSWILFRSEAPLVPGAEGAQLYRWTLEGGLKLESRLPDGSIPGFFGFLALTQANDQRTHLPLASADGSLVAFDLNKFPAFGIGGVYVREDEQSTAISVSHRAVDDSSQVRAGTVDWVTPSGHYVFFHTAAEVQLTEDTPPPTGPENVYRYDTETRDLIYISPLRPGGSTIALNGVSEDGQTVYLNDSANSVVWHEGDLENLTPDYVGILASYMTDSGRYFAWVGSDGEAHLYDLESGDATCVSCPTNGSSLGTAHFVPRQRGLGNVSPRGVLEDGTMFFDTPNPLLPADHNSKQDVYSYKDGYLTLISPGNANLSASFVDVSEDGKDVYFETQQGILPQDVDGSTDVYDARAGGGFSQQEVAVACSGEDCRGPVGTAPKGATIGSSGAGQSAGPVIGRLKSLTASELARLAKGKKVHLKLFVNRSGKVKAIGTASVGQVISASTRAKQAGPVSVSIKLSKKGLKYLKRTGSLAIRLTVSLDGDGQKVTSFTLKSAGRKKGGSS